jgi:iron complex transport system substrate-binding protein
VDILGRTVTLDAPARRIILGEGRFLAAIGILDRKDPLARIAGMLNEFKRYDPAGYAHYRAAFPGIDDIPVFGQTSAASVSVERAIALRPEVAIFGIEGHGPGARSRKIIDTLEAAGIKTVFIDFRRAPLENTARSVEILGRVLGREKAAAAFVRFYRDNLDIVERRVAALDGKRPRVLLEARVGLGEECCLTMVEGMMGRFIDVAGGDNIGRGVVPGPVGTLNLEYVLAHPPDIYVGTAVGAPASVGAVPARIILGPGATPAMARTSLARALARPGLETLPAARDGRAYGIWHHFYNSPLNVYAVQVLAKWFHPDAFDDLDPEATLREMFERFQPVPLDGVYAIGMK